MAAKSSTSPHAFNPDAKPFQPESHPLNAAAAPFKPNPDALPFTPMFYRAPELRAAPVPLPFTEATVPILSGFRLPRPDAAAQGGSEVDAVAAPVAEPTTRRTSPGGVAHVRPEVAAHTTSASPPATTSSRASNPRPPRLSGRPSSQQTPSPSALDPVANVEVAATQHVDPSMAGPSRLLAVPRSTHDGPAPRRRGESSATSPHTVAPPPTRRTPPSPGVVAHYKPLPTLHETSSGGAEGVAPVPPSVLQWQPPQKRLLERVAPSSSSTVGRPPSVPPAASPSTANPVVTPKSEHPSSTTTSRENVDSSVAERLNNAVPYIPKHLPHTASPASASPAPRPTSAAHHVLPVVSVGPRRATPSVDATVPPASVPLAAGAHLRMWQPPQPLKVARLRAARRPSSLAFSPENPLVVLIFGCRGAGKTTQAARLAARYSLLHLSSGDLVAQHKNPYEELRSRVLEHFGPTATPDARRYHGVVLDRFLAISEADGYYLQWALSAAGLPVPLAFWLRIDPGVALARASARGDGKVALERWRLEEQRVQSAIAETIYAPARCLVPIDCDGLDVDAVTEHMVSAIEASRGADARARRLPPMTLVPGHPTLRLVDDFAAFTALANEVHVCIGNVTGRRDSAPLSLIGSYISRESFAGDEGGRGLNLSAMNVALKIDGRRFLVVKHRTHGVFGFPLAFTSCYDFGPLFAGLPFRPPTAASETGQGGMEFMLDVELVVEASRGADTGRVTLHVIDYLYFYGALARRTVFETRYKALKAWFEQMLGAIDPTARSRCAVVLKKYVPINRLGELLAESATSSWVQVDGVVFQHNKTYRYALDPDLCKWKPRELCTADFRLMGGQPSEDGRSWVFRLYVSDLYAKAVQPEREFPGALGVFSSELVEAENLRDNVVVELSLAETGRSGDTRWAFHRRRDDKPAPNKYSVVSKIVDMQHLTSTELVNLCSKIRYTGTLQ